MSDSCRWVCLRKVAAVSLVGLVMTAGCAPMYFAGSLDLPEAPQDPHSPTTRVMLYLPSDTFSIPFPLNYERPPGKTERTRIEEVVQVIRRVTEQTSLFHMIPASNQPEKVSEADYIMTLRFQLAENMDRGVVTGMRIFLSAATLGIFPLWVPYDVYLSAHVIYRNNQQSRDYTIKSLIVVFMQTPLFMFFPLHQWLSASRALEIVAEQLTRKLYADMQQEGLF